MPKSLYRPEYDIFLEMLRKARLAAGLTQRQVAARLGRPQSYVSKVESGERRCDVLEFRELCRALELDPVEFFATLEHTWKQVAPQSE